jgi:hypothetical protein
MQAVDSRFILFAPAVSVQRHGGQVSRGVPGGYAAWNRGADFVQPLAPALRAGTRSWTGHRDPHNQAALACTAPGAGQHRD